MIIQPFKVRSKGKRYDFIDHALLDSKADRDKANRLHAAALDYVQTDALCENRGMGCGDIDNRVIVVFDDGAMIGIWMLGSITYVSGPWADLQSWEVVDPGADVIIDAVPMSGVLGMSEDGEADFAAETAAIMVSRPNLGLMSGQGLAVGIDRLHYGVFKDHDDPASMRAKSHHAKVKAHPRLTVAEVPHPTIPHLTLAEIRAA